MNCTLKLISLSCFRSSESDGDEIYLIVNKRKIWPLEERFKELKSSASLQLNLEINVQMNKPINIELWEHDTFFDDHLGSFEFSVDGNGNGFVTDLKRIKPDAVERYSLTWESRVSKKKNLLEIAD